MIRKLCECLSSVTAGDNGDVFIFSPMLGNYKLEYKSDMIGYDYKLTIPFEDKQTSLILDEICLKKFAVMLGIGAKHFDVLIQSENKLIENINEMLSCSEQDFFFLTSGSSHAVSDVSVNTEPIKISEILDCVKVWIKSGSDDSEPDNAKDWTDESLSDKLCVYYYSLIDGVTSLAFGLNYKSTGWFLKCNRLGSFKPTIWPCVFKKNLNSDYVPIIFDIYGITENKPVFKQNVDVQTNVSTILSEAEDFIYDNSKKLKFELARSIDQEQYLKHLSSETKIPKKYIKKGIIAGGTIESIVNSICNECLNLLNTEEVAAEDVNKNLCVFEKLSKAAGYAIFYQNRLCNCCFKTATLAEDNN